MSKYLVAKIGFDTEENEPSKLRSFSLHGAQPRGYRKQIKHAFCKLCHIALGSDCEMRVLLRTGGNAVKHKMQLAKRALDLKERA